MIQAENEIASSSIAREVYAILNRSCFECHGPARQEGGLRLDSNKAITAGGDSGVVFDVKAPDASELLRRIRLPKGHGDVMPNRGALLTTREIARIREWISLGAPWSTEAAASRHWAYIPPSKSDDAQRRDKLLNPIDYFIQKRLESESLTGSPPAVPHTIARRLYLDIIGLPPTPGQVKEPRMTTMYARGDFRNPTRSIEPSTPEILHPSEEMGDLNRLELARWLVSRKNPLVARVVVNRLWSELFGIGLVATPEDFGLKGDMPSHPELLDGWQLTSWRMVGLKRKSCD